MTTTPAPAATVDSTPYPWPYHGRFDPRRAALVACLDRGWRLERPAGGEADARLAQVASGLRALGGLVVAVTWLPRRRGGPPPAGIGSSDGLAVTADHEVVAGGSSAFFESPLDGLLRRAERTDLIVAGWGLEGPVHSTLRDANDRGYECLLVPDASVAIDPDLAEPACSMVRFSGGIFGAYAGTNQIIEALSGKRTQP